MKAFKWWDEPPLPEGARWKYIEHCGVSFPPPYQPHGVKMKYDGVVRGSGADAWDCDACGGFVVVCLGMCMSASMSMSMSMSMLMSMSMCPH